MRWIAATIMVCGLIAGVGLLAQESPALSSEQVAIQRALLAKDAAIGDLLKQSASCQAELLDLAKLKARVAQLEAAEKKTDKPAQQPSAKP